MAAVSHGDHRTAHIDNNHYLMTALAPAASSLVLIVSASAFGMPSLTVEGAPSTKSFASLRPRPVISRMTLITPTLLAPNSVIVTVNSVCTSAAGAAAAPAPAAAAATGAASGTLNFFSMSAINSTTSMTVILEIESRISSLVTAIIVSKYLYGSRDPNQDLIRRRLRRTALLGFKNSSQRPYQLRVGSSQRTNELRNRRLEHTQQLRQRLRARRQ